MHTKIVRRTPEPVELLRDRALRLVREGVFDKIFRYEVDVKISSRYKLTRKRKKKLPPPLG